MAAGISGVHIVIYSRSASRDREFLRTVLGFDSVDAGDGWLIFALPPAELGIHPTREPSAHELFLTCADLDATRASLRKVGARVSRPVARPWGRLVRLRLPSGARIGIYEPSHARAVAPAGRKSRAKGQRPRRSGDR